MLRSLYVALSLPLDRFAGRPVVVTELDVRYLAHANVSPVRTKCRLVGTAPDDPVEVRLIDTATGRISTLVYARAVPASPDRAAQVLHGADRSEH